MPDPTVPRRPLPAFLLAAGIALQLAAMGGCSSTREIVAEPPRPAETAQPDADPEPRVEVTVRLGTGRTTLPEEVAALRFRVEELHFHRRDSSWSAYPADVNAFEVRGAGVRPQRIVLATELPPAAYDSIAVVLRDLYVSFGPAAGAPLTRDPALTYAIPIPVDARPDTALTIDLTLEAGASILRAPDCRWLFTPFLTAAVNGEAGR